MNNGNKRNEDEYENNCFTNPILWAGCTAVYFFAEWSACWCDGQVYPIQVPPQLPIFSVIAMSVKATTGCPDNLHSRLNSGNRPRSDCQGIA